MSGNFQTGLTGASRSSIALTMARRNISRILAISSAILATSLSVAEETRGLSASFENRENARTMLLTIPAPRGLITDREGRTLAQNVVAYELSLQFPQLNTDDDAAVLAWARQRVEAAAALSDRVREVSDRTLLSHYRERRWLPLALSSGLPEATAKQIEESLTNGLILHPIYLRNYPEKSLAAHIIGYVRSDGKLPAGPINLGDPLWETTSGDSGLEKVFDDYLRGKSGSRKMLFDSDGSRVVDSITPPQTGHTVITTLDLDWQKRAEKVLRDGCERGAFVVIDIYTGEVLTMASRPTFDLNVFIPRISEEDYRGLVDDEASPLYARAFQAEYPPASAFKPVVALSALHRGVITENSRIDAPAFLKFGQHTLYNWNKRSEGKLDVRKALARSNNPWFCQVGIDVGAESFLSLARDLGLGKKTGLPLPSEAAGLVPTDDYMLRNHNRRITEGDTANLSIGQGTLLASPLQVAQMMAGIANGRSLPRLHLIKQVQDINGAVVVAARPAESNSIDLDPVSALIVRQGMRDVVSAGYGTGKRGSLSFTQLCGKTGTAQWGAKSKDQRLAWFAGFFPFDSPRFAFAALYEGKPGETLSGGRMAAPMVKSFFETFDDEIKVTLKPPAAAVVVVEEGVVGAEADEVSVAERVDPDELDIPEPLETIDPPRAERVDLPPIE